ncbi:MAG: ATP synthase F1 subunit delta [Ferruginibacter sp.]
MNNPRLAGRYGKSLLDLAIEQNQLDAVYADMKFLHSVFKSNPDFTAIFLSPVINADKKEKIIESITNGRISNLTESFIKLLVRKTRENVLPQITNAFIEQYNRLKDIHQVKLTTAIPMSADLQETILGKIRANTKVQNIELETVVEEELIGGFKLELGNILIDATVLRDLNDVKKQFKSNEYIQRLR